MSGALDLARLQNEREVKVRKRPGYIKNGVQPATELEKLETHKYFQLILSNVC